MNIQTVKETIGWQVMMQILATAAKFRSLRPTYSSNLLSSSLVPRGRFGMPCGLLILLSFGNMPLASLPMLMRAESSFEEDSLASTSKLSCPDSNAASLSSRNNDNKISTWYQMWHYQYKNFKFMMILPMDLFSLDTGKSLLRPSTSDLAWLVFRSQLPPWLEFLWLLVWLVDASFLLLLSSSFEQAAALAGLRWNALSSGNSLKD